MLPILPLGFRFIPTAQELLIDYLKRRVKREALPCEGVVNERELYRDAPWNIFKEQDPWDTFKIKDNKYKHVIYVFTKLKTERIGAKKIIIRRTGDSGTWDGETRVERIYNEQNELIGFEKKLIFKADAKKKEEAGRWIMHEYSLGGVSLDETGDDHDYVVCKITISGDSKSLKTATKRDRDNIDEVSDQLIKASDEDPTHKKMRYDDEASTSHS